MIDHINGRLVLLHHRREFLSDDRLSAMKTAKDDNTVNLVQQCISLNNGRVVTVTLTILRRYLQNEGMIIMNSIEQLKLLRFKHGCTLVVATHDKNDCAERKIYEYISIVQQRFVRQQVSEWFTSTRSMETSLFEGIHKCTSLMVGSTTEQMFGVLQLTLNSCSETFWRIYTNCY